MLRATTLVKRFGAGRPALDGVSFDVRDGELCLLAGRNGAGKTTTIGCIVDLVRPDAGRVEIDGVCVATSPVRARRGVAYLAEHVALYPAMTGVENVRFFAGLADRRLSALEAAELLERLGLPSAAASRSVRTYSKGMRQRVGLAVAVAGRARNLVLDEPTSGLDPAAAADLLGLLRGLGDDGRAVLVSSHDIGHVARVADHVVCLARGAVAAACRVADVGAEALEPWFDAAAHAEEDA